MMLGGVSSSSHCSTTALLEVFLKPASIVAQNTTASQQLMRLRLIRESWPRSNGVARVWVRSVFLQVELYGTGRKAGMVHSSSCYGLSRHKRSQQMMRLFVEGHHKMQGKQKFLCSGISSSLAHVVPCQFKFKVELWKVSYYSLKLLWFQGDSGLQLQTFVCPFHQVII
jgi:hypothetical protein